MKQLLLFVGILYTLTARSQNASSLSLSIGWSNPKGQFAATNIDDSTSGYATIGTALVLTYELTQPNGLGAFIRYQTAGIGFDAEKFIYDLENDDGGSSFKNTEYVSRRYNITSFNAGLLYVFNREHKLKITPFLGLGLSLCRNREIDMTFSNGIGNIRLNTYSDNESTLNINFGLAVGYDLSDHVSIFLKTNYQSQVPTFNNVFQSYANGNPVDTDTQAYGQPQYFSTTTLGVKYSF